MTWVELHKEGVNFRLEEAVSSMCTDFLYKFKSRKFKIKMSKIFENEERDFDN